MRSPFVVRIATLLCLAAILFAGSAMAQKADSKPLLSEEILSVLDNDGAEAATRRFGELFPSQKSSYEVDQKAFVDMATEAMKNGDFETGQTILNMVTIILQESLADIRLEMPEMPEMPEPPEMPEMPEPPPPPRGESGVVPPTPAKATESAGDAAQAGRNLGPARSDLARFHGVYGTEEQATTGRMLFVSESCNGYLVAGAMWGDASNWWLKSTSDNIFDHGSTLGGVHMEFTLSAEGKAEAMIHDLDFMPNPLPRVGPLPEEWTACIPPQGG
jgi:hypothetical protein